MRLNLFGREVNLKTWVAVLGAVVLLAGLGIAGYIMSGDDQAVVIEKQQEGTVEAEESKTEDKSIVGKDTSIDSEEIQVYVVGCVKKPGIVKLRKGQIIDDAIKAAGGATEDADLEYINMVYKLNENVTLRIKSKKDREAQEKLNTQVKQSENTTQIKGVEIIKDSGGIIESENEKNAGGTSGGKINLNTATIEELETLPGIGVESAKDIIAYREKTGKFKKIEDIMNVPGIKESRFSKLKDYITV